MKRRTVTEVARNFSAVIDSVEKKQEEIILTRNQKRVARIVPEPAAQNALEVLGDLYRTMDDKTADALVAAIASTRKGRGKKLSDLRGPWAS